MARLRHSLEYAVYRLLRGGLRLLPSRAAAELGGALALAAQELLGWRRSTTRDRIAQIFPEMPKGERERVRRAALRNLGRNAVEMMRVGAEPPPIDGIEEAFAAVQSAREKGKGVLVVIAHSGNWDLAGVIASRRGIPMCFIARHQKNERIYRDLLRAREAGGGLVVDRDDPKLLRRLLDFLARNGAVAILVDIRSRTKGETFRFLGHEAPLANGLGLLAAKSGAEVLPVFLGRGADGRHFWKALPARRLRPEDSRESRHQLLQSCLDDLGSEILRNPEGYFWFNKRWMLEPHA